MKKLKKMMFGKRRSTFGKYTVIKELAHRFDEQLNEHFFYIYRVVNNENGKEVL